MRLNLFRNFRWRRMADRHGPRRLIVADTGDTEIRVIIVERKGSEPGFIYSRIIPHERTHSIFENPEFISSLEEAGRITPYISLVWSEDDGMVRLMNFPGTPGRPEAITQQVRQALGTDDRHDVVAQVIGKTDKQFSVLASSMLKMSVTDLYDYLERRGLKPVSLVHPGVALANLAEAGSETFDAQGNTGVLHADVKSSLLSLRINGQNVLIRQLKEGLESVYRSIEEAYGLEGEMAVKLFNSGSFDISAQSSSFMGSWFHQVELSLDFVERRMGGRIDKLFLSGASLGLNILRDNFRQSLGCDVEIIPALPGFSCPTLEGRLAEGQNPVTPYLIAASEGVRIIQNAQGKSDAV